MAKTSAGFLMYRKKESSIEVLIAHMGGPFYAKKDEGFWSFPKGEAGDGEDLLEAARREFKEETGIEPSGDFIPLGEVKHTSGKTIHAWAFEGDCDPDALTSNTFELEWPPKSGNVQAYPENDRAMFADPETAKRKLVMALGEFVDRLIEALDKERTI